MVVIAGVDGVDQFGFIPTGLDDCRHKLTIIWVETREPRILRKFFKPTIRMARDPNPKNICGLRGPPEEKTTRPGLTRSAGPLQTLDKALILAED